MSLSFTNLPIPPPNLDTQQVRKCNSETNLNEIFARLEHKRWLDWQMHLHSICVKNEDGSLTIPKEYVETFERQINTPFDDLPKDEKVASRIEASITLDLVGRYYKPKWLDEEEQARGGW